jgi:hypothetical protein
MSVCVKTYRSLPPWLPGIVLVSDYWLGGGWVGRTLSWWVAGLLVVAAFGATTWVAGAFLLPLMMNSAADRWVVAAGLGVALGGLVALWGQSWVTRESSAEPSVDGRGGRSITAGGDISGIASTGDDATNAQCR